ncbi:MAG: hypothetical protein BGO86_04870 [Chryseobacterium sp. 36-9]|nr:MAG: hypothetical protein BGO86_04870 [Chryseobacterium sp. 36-9]
MKKKFITYGSNQFLQSAKRIIEEAKSLNIFDETQHYDYPDLPLTIQSSPLFMDDRKGGYWLWKAYVIYHSLKKLNDGDVLVYSDSGCELKKNDDGWNEHFNYLKNNDAIFFQYRSDKNYGWSQFNSDFQDSPKLKFWVKKNTIDHFRPIFKDDETWLDKNKLMAGLIFIKKNQQTLQLIKDWLDVMQFHPELVIDPMIEERNHQMSGFSSHRHDQSILSIIVRFYESTMDLKIIDECSEGDYPNQIAKASRRLDKIEKNKITDFLKKIYYKING